MAKLRRESAPPEHNALRSRGTPSPEHDRRPYRAPRTSRTSRTRAAVVERGIPHEQALRSAERGMLDAQARVRQLKESGQDYRSATVQARLLRARWLELGGGLESRIVEAAGYEAPSR